MPELHRRGHDLIFRHFRAILDTIQDGVYISDAEGTTLLVNRAYERLVGVPASDLVGKSVHELVASGFFNTIVNPKVVASGAMTASAQEVRGRKVVLYGYPVLDQEGEVDLVVTFVRDITAFTRLKREITTQRALLDSYQRQVANYNIECVYGEDGMVAESPASIELADSADNIAGSDAAVLILGETGVGKDVLARRIHTKSGRHDKPMLKVDCTAIPESLVESELFGYAPGAFSGAHAKGREGFFEKANTGTLFLDEIGELSPSMQTKLLRAIQDQEIVRLGSTKIIPIDVRIIAATHRDLEEAVLEGSFRSDLFYRLKVAVLYIKPLRERRDDILPLARFFIHRYNSKYNKNISLSSEAQNALFHYKWPGNVRELENTIHSIVVTSSNERITCSDLPRAFVDCTHSHEIMPNMKTYEIGNRSLKEIMRDIEQELINETVAIYGSLSKSAEVLQVDRTTLFRKMKAGSEPNKKDKK